MQWLLLPLAGLFLLGAFLRRLAYRLRLLPVHRLPVPVIVVGNITLGGTGKTPLTLWLAQRLRAAGWRPGIVSRGYGGRQRGPAAVTPASDPYEVGDEPLLLARRSGLPVYIARRRVEAARALLAAHPHTDVLIADDGLQHYALARDVEIAVVDGQRRFGNGWPLPAGPLRELPGRLRRVDAIVLHGGEDMGWLRTDRPVHRMRLVPQRLRALDATGREQPLSWLSGRQVHAVAGIGHPARFFELLRALGAAVEPHPFPDHHRFRPQDLPSGTVVMTEKDAVKCAAFARADDWVLEVDAAVDPALINDVLHRIENRHGPETA
ncbi:MAG: tetraacyldisaccharide 4'-kinase [Burkholderiales bacterium]|nr:tetraacyldisaccharide 4'-kinase [Burkholderiales bacterium]